MTTVAIYEPNAEVRRAYVDFLTGRGYNVLDPSERQLPDVAVVEPLGVNNPIQFLKSGHRVSPRTHFILATKAGEILTLSRVIPNCAAITKPFHLEELEELISVCLAPEEAYGNDHFRSA